MNKEIHMNAKVKGNNPMNHIQSNVLWFGIVLVSIGLTSLAAVSQASVTVTDQFTTGISGAWTTSISSTLNPGTGTVTWNPSGYVDITQSTNLYANIRESVGPGVQSVSADINNVSDTGSISWAPSMVIYYDANNWIEFGLSSIYGFLAQVDSGVGPSFGYAGPGLTLNTWNTLEVKLNPATGKAEFYEGPQGGPLTHVTLGLGGTLQDTAVPSSFFTDSAYLILGKGYSNPPTNTFFNNDTTPGSPGGESLFDNAVVVTPEPASLSLLAASGVILLGKRRSRARC